MRRIVTKMIKENVKKRKETDQSALFLPSKIRRSPFEERSSSSGVRPLANRDEGWIIPTVPLIVISDSEESEAWTPEKASKSSSDHETQSKSMDCNSELLIKKEERQESKK